VAIDDFGWAPGGDGFGLLGEVSEAEQANNHHPGTWLSTATPSPAILCQCAVTRVEQPSFRFIDAPADFSPLFLNPLKQFLAVNLHICRR